MMVFFFESVLHYRFIFKIIAAPHITEITPSSPKKSGMTGVKLSGTSFGGTIALARGKVTLSMDGVPLTMYQKDFSFLFCYAIFSISYVSLFFSLFH
jgi:hypothetical protein